MKQYSRRNSVLINRISESDKRPTDKIVLSIANQYSTNITIADIDRSHRIGKEADGKARAILPVVHRWNVLKLLDPVQYHVEGARKALKQSAWKLIFWFCLYRLNMASTLNSMSINNWNIFLTYQKCVGPFGICVKEPMVNSSDLDQSVQMSNVTRVYSNFIFFLVRTVQMSCLIW